MVAGPVLSERTLDDQIVLVAGGAGFLGRFIVSGLLKAGATVIVPSRSEDRLAELRSQVSFTTKGVLATVQGDVGRPDGAAEILSFVRAQVGGLTAVVAALGGWWEGSRLTSVSTDTWDELIAGGLTSHFVAAKTFVPELQRAGRMTKYLFLNGIAASRPIAGSGPVSVTGAAQRMLTLVLAEELKGTLTIAQELALYSPVVADKEQAVTEHPGEPVLLGDAVSERVVSLLDEGSLDDTLVDMTGEVL